MAGEVNATLAIRVSELRVMFRNKVVLAATVLVPLIMAIGLLRIRATLVDVAGLAVPLTALIQGLGCYMGLTGTFAARRASSYLKRLRTTPLRPRSILIALALPVVGVNAIQLVVVLVVLALTAGSPMNPILVAIGAAALELLFLLAAAATSGVTRTADQAQITTIPFFGLVVGAAAWVSLNAGRSPIWLVLGVPGVAPLEVVAGAWTGHLGQHPLLLLAGTTLWLAIGAVAARGLFRWHEREVRSSH